jgi:hypothetical protein
MNDIVKLLIPSLTGKFFILCIYSFGPTIPNECDWTIFIYLMYTLIPLLIISILCRIIAPKKISFKISMYYIAMCVCNIMSYTFFIISNEFRTIVYYTIKCHQQESKNSIVGAEIFEYSFLMLTILCSSFEFSFFVVFLHKRYIFYCEN